MCADRNVNALIGQLICNFEYVRQLACLVSLPPFVNYSLIDSMLAMLVIGFKVALIPDYKPEKLGSYIEKYKPYHISSIPAYWEALLKIKDIQSVDMSCLRYLYYGGEAMSVENELAVTALVQSCGAKGQLCKGLGSTEMMAAATQTYADCNAEGSAGVPLVYTNCKIVEPDTAEELTYGQIGEICFTGPTLMMGYYNRPEATDAIIKRHADGQRWLHTGDLGYLEENGVLYVTGRIKRILMTKGRDGNITKIFPDRIEKTVSEHGAVAVCCAIGVQDEIRINYPVVFVVGKPIPGSRSRSQSRSSLCAGRSCRTIWCRKLSSFGTTCQEHLGERSIIENWRKWHKILKLHQLKWFEKPASCRAFLYI